MEHSLTVLLPVHNAQAGLERKVTAILDLLPELTRSFEVMIVDDGSTDATSEVAHELAMRFPQVNVARHAARQGLAQSVATGVEATRGEIIALHDQVELLEPAQLVRLWRRIHGREQSAAAPVRKPLLFSRLLGRRSTKADSGFQMIQRKSLRAGRQVRSDVAVEMPSTARPNFLGSLRKFALGE